MRHSVRKKFLTKERILRLASWLLLDSKHTIYETDKRLSHIHGPNIFIDIWDMIERERGNEREKAKKGDRQTEKERGLREKIKKKSERPLDEDRESVFLYTRNRGYQAVHTQWAAIYKSTFLGPFLEEATVVQMVPLIGQPSDKEGTKNDQSKREKKYKETEARRKPVENCYIPC